MTNWSVDYSPQAARQLADRKRVAENSPGSAHATAYDGIKRAITDVIANPALVLARQHMLHAPLNNVLRVKVLGRTRILYIASSKKRRSTVLWIGYRKKGDKNDAYASVTRLIRRGAFDQQFAALGVAKPKL